MRDVSDFRGNFAKTKAKNLQKVPNQRHQNFGSELYGFGMFVKRNIIVVSLRTQVSVKKFHWQLGPLKVIFCIKLFSWPFWNNIVLNQNFDAVDLAPSKDFLFCFGKVTCKVGNPKACDVLIFAYSWASESWSVLEFNIFTTSRNKTKQSKNLFYVCQLNIYHNMFNLWWSLRDFSI